MNIKTTKSATASQQEGKTVNKPKIGVGHLTPGTVFSAKVMGQPDREYIVKHLICTAPGRYAVVTTTNITEPDSMWDNSPEIIDIQQITKIISRAPGSPICSLSLSPIKPALTQVPKYATLSEIIVKYTLNDPVPSGVKAQRRAFNFEKTEKHLKALGLIKSTVGVNSCAQPHVDTLYKTKEVLKFLNKYPHFAYRSIKESKEMYEKMVSNLFKSH